MNLAAVREILARVSAADEAFTDGADDYGHELLKDLIDDLVQWLENRERAGRGRGAES